MKQRNEYANNGLGLRLAIAQRDKFGGRVVTTESRTLWYSFHHTPTEIFKELPGNVKIHD